VRESAIAQSCRRASRSLLLTYVLVLLHAYSYFSFAGVLTPFLAENVGLDDTQSGYIYTAIGLLASVYGSLIGLIIDELSVFIVACAGAVMLIVGRVLLLYAVPLDGSSYSIIGVTCLLVTLFPCGDVLLTQAVRIGIKRYVVVDGFATFPSGAGTGGAGGGDDDSASTTGTSEANADILTLPPRAEELTGPKRAVEYSTSYSLQNGGSLLAYATVWLLTVQLGVPALTNTYAAFAGLGALVLCVVVSVAGALTDQHDIDKEVAERERTLRDAEAMREHAVRTGQLTRWDRCVECVRPRCCSAYLITGRMGGLFARYLYVSFALVGAKTLFRQIDATLPKYTQRVFYANFPYAALMMINPALCLVLAPFAQSLLLRFETQRLFIAGTALCAVATALAMWPEVAALVIFCVLLTLGELTWSPRYEDWTWRAAPQGQEGAFGSVALAPMFLGKMGAGIASGYLLERYCPEDATQGACVAPGVWGSLAAMGITSPLLLLVAHRWIKSGDTPLDERPLDTDIVLQDIETAAGENPHGGRRVRRGKDTSTSVEGDRLTPRTGELLDYERRKKIVHMSDKQD
jgi:hypothetical protein